MSAKRGIMLIALLCAKQRSFAGEGHLPVAASAKEVRSSHPEERWKGSSLQRARLSKKMKERILRDLFGDPLTLPLDSELQYTMVLPFTVGDASQPRQLLRVLGGGTSCGNGVCGMLIYDARSGEKLLDDGGWNFRFLRTAHAGAHDVLIRDKSSCSEGSKALYRYDGRRYQLIWRTAEQY